MMDGLLNETSSSVALARATCMFLTFPHVLLVPSRQNGVFFEHFDTRRAIDSV